LGTDRNPTQRGEKERSGQKTLQEGTSKGKREGISDGKRVLSSE